MYFVYKSTCATHLATYTTKVLAMVGSSGTLNVLVFLGELVCEPWRTQPSTPSTDRHPAREGNACLPMKRGGMRGETGKQSTVMKGQRQSHQSQKGMNKRKKRRRRTQKKKS